MQDVDVSNYQQPNMAHLGQAEVAKHTIFTNSNIYHIYILSVKMISSVRWQMSSWQNKCVHKYAKYLLCV